MISTLCAELTARADDVLAGVTDRTVARARLLEELALDYPDLTTSHRAEIVAGVLATLAAEEFFGWEFCGDPFSDDSELAESEEF